MPYAQSAPSLQNAKIASSLVVLGVHIFHVASRAVIRVVRGLRKKQRGRAPALTRISHLKRRRRSCELLQRVC